MVLWFFNKVAWLVLAAMLEGILLPSNMAAKTTFCLYLVKCLIVTFRCNINVTTTTSSFQHFAWSLVQNLCQKAVIHDFKKHVLVTWPFYSNGVGLKIKSLLFCLRYDPLTVFRRQKHVSFIFTKTMSHDLLVQVAYWLIDWSIDCLLTDWLADWLIDWMSD